MCPGAAEGVGSATVQLGVALGARVVATVRSEAAREVVAGLGAEAIPDDGFAAKVSAQADVIVELVGAPHFPANFEALAPRGRIVIVGVGAGQEVAVPLLTLMRKRATIVGTVLRSRPLEEKAAAVRAFEREVLPLLARGRVRPLVDSIHPAAEFATAFDRLGGRGKVGKVLLDFG